MPRLTEILTAKFNVMRKNYVIHPLPFAMVSDIATKVIRETHLHVPVAIYRINNSLEKRVLEIS